MPLPTGQPLFTVFTPTYNRAHTIHRVFDSLCAQTIRGFEWLVVDDGSTDATAELVAGWTKIADFPIRYFRQDHAGKHIAHNRAIREARGRFFLPLDSDDAYVPQAMDRIINCWNSIPPNNRESFCGVAGLCIDQHGKLVGERFPSNPLDADMRARRYVYRVRGEKCVVIRTDMVRKFPFPEIRGTNFIPEGTLWLDMAKTHKIRWVNEVFRIYYIDDTATGTTLTERRDLDKSAPGRLHYYVWLLNNDLEYFFCSPAPFLKAALMLPVAAWASGQSFGRIWASLATYPAKLIGLLAFPFALLLYAVDKFRMRRVLGKRR